MVTAFLQASYSVVIPAATMSSSAVNLCASVVSQTPGALEGLLGGATVVRREPTPVYRVALLRGGQKHYDTAILFIHLSCMMFHSSIPVPHFEGRLGIPGVHRHADSIFCLAQQSPPHQQRTFCFSISLDQRAILSFFLRWC